MPDGDVFTRSVTPRWRHLVKGVRDDLPVAECVYRLEDAMAQQLRKTGGLGYAPLQILVGQTNGADVETRVAKALRELARRDVFERVVPLLITKGRFPTYDKAQDFVAYCLGEARMELLARSLARQPNAAGLRRPPRSHSSIADLLAESAPLGSQA